MPDPRANLADFSFGFSSCSRAARTSVLHVLAGCSAALSATAEPAIGQFELKTLECKPGLIEFQSQNAYSWGQPSRQFVDDGTELVFDENSVERQRYAQELEFGFTKRLKMRVGIEFEEERIEDPPTVEQANDFEDLELTEYGAEMIAVFIPREADGAGLGFVVEYEAPLDDEESSALVLGPIIEYQSGPWFAAAVPMVVHAFGGEAEEGEEIDDKWDFAYAAQLAYTLSPAWTLAMEAYGTVERIGSTGNPSESAQIFGDFDQHRLGPVVYFNYPLGGSGDAAPDSSLLSDEDEGTSLDIGLGLLAGLNSNTPDLTLKLSIEVQF
jgi:hypothetical protein